MYEVEDKVCMINMRIVAFMMCVYWSGARNEGCHSDTARPRNWEKKKKKESIKNSNIAYTD